MPCRKPIAHNFGKNHRILSTRRLNSTCKEQSANKSDAKKGPANWMLAGLYTVTKYVTNCADVWGVQGNCHQICNQIEGNGGQWG